MKALKQQNLEGGSMYVTTEKATRQEYLNGNDVEEPEHRRAAVFDLFIAI